MKTVCIGIARLGSSRLPGKVMFDLGGEPVIAWVARAAKTAHGIDEFWIATSELKADNAIEKWCGDHDIPCFRGSETDVLKRFTGAAEAAKADIVVRVTCDCALLDPEIIGA